MTRQTSVSCLDQGIRRVLFGLLLATAGSGCATSQYGAQVVAQGELTMRFDGGFVVEAGGQRLSQGYTYPHLDHFVRCVPKAQEHAQAARRSGRLAVGLSAAGGIVGASGLVGLAGLADQNHLFAWLGTGIALSTTGLVLTIVGYRYKTHANGHALDAVNFYNDSVGSLGASCDALSYPPPIADAPVAPPGVAPSSLPAPPMAAPTPSP